MSGFEIFGTLGSAAAVIEAILVTTSYIQDVKNAKREKEKLDGYLDTFDSLIADLKTRLLPGTSKTIHTLVGEIQRGLDDIREKKNSSNSFKWKFTKEKLKDLWLNLEHLKTFLTLGVVSHTSDILHSLCADNSIQHQSILNELRLHASNHQAAIADLQLYIKHESRQASEELRSHISAVVEPITDLSQANKIQHMQGMQDWLSPNYSVQNELDTLAVKRAPGSGEWLLATEKFVTWLRKASEGKVFILAGPAGCGKTILSGQVSERIRQGSLPCLPVFIKHSNKMDTVMILRRLLSAALGFVKTIPEELEELRRENSFDRAKLSKIFQKILTALPDPAHIILDALDELDVNIRKEVVEMITGSFSNVKLFIASRPLPLLEEFSSSILDLESSDLDDLQAFIKVEVSAIGRGLGCPDAEIDELIGRVNEASSELFLLASLHIRTLRQCQRRFSAKLTAKKLPRTTEGHYRLSIDRIRARGLEDSETSDAALSSLLWVWKAKRPLTLAALSAAVASVMNDLTGEEVDEYLIEAVRLLEFCEGLLQVQDEMVTFSHVTILEFFEAQETSVLIDDAVPHSIFSKALPCLGSACLGYLNASHEERTIASLSPDMATQPQTFINYCSTFWGSHLPHNATPEGIAHLQTNEQIFPRVALVRARFSFPGKLESEEDGAITMSHIAASFNLTSYLCATPAAEHRIFDSSNRSPLHYACALGCADAVSLLLSLGLDLNQTSNQGKTPLLLALENRHSDVAKLLLDQDSLDPNAVDSNSRATPLIVALGEGMDDLVDKLLSRSDVDMNLQDNDGDCALFAACDLGKWEIAERMIARPDVNVNLKDIYGLSAVHNTCADGNLTILQLLLERPGIEFNSAANIYKDTPLHIACRSGRSDLVHILLEVDGIQPNEQNREGMTPLDVAWQEGCLDVFNLLLSRNDIPPTYPDDFDANKILRQACVQGHPNIVRSLLDKPGVDLESSDSDGMTPFLLACANGRQNVIELLLLHPKINPNRRDVNGVAGLSFACRNGLLEAVKVLLSLDSIVADIRSVNGRSPLHYLCESGHNDLLSLLLERNDVDKNARDTHGDTPMALACEFGHYDMVELLLQSNEIETNSSNNNGESPLHLACAGGHIKVVTTIVDKGFAKLDQIDLEGNTVLHFAAQNGHSGLVTFLLASDIVSPDSLNLNGVTPLHQASANGHLEVVALLLSRLDVDLNRGDKNGNTALSLACGYGHTHVVKALLLHASINPDPQEISYGTTPLLIACHYGHLDIAKLLLARDDVDRKCVDAGGLNLIQEACSSGLTDVVKILIASGKADLACRTLGGDTLLHLACSRGHLELARLLFSEGDIGDLNPRTSADNTPLHSACWGGHMSVVDFLLSEPAVEKNCVNHQHWSPLHFACFGGFQDIAKRLLDQGLDPNQRSKEGWSPLALAVNHNFPDIVQLLLTRADVNIDIRSATQFSLLHWACGGGYLGIVDQLFVNHSFNIMEQDRQGRSSLHWACNRGSQEIVSLLLSREPDMYLNARDHEGRSSLSLASCSGSIEVVKALLSDPLVNPDLRDDNGVSPLMGACASGHLHIADALLSQSNVEIDGRSYFGDSALMDACWGGHTGVVELLLSKGLIQLDARADDGHTPFSLACRAGHVGIAKRLLDHLPSLDFNSQTVFGHTPLALACDGGHYDTVEFLLSHDPVDVNLPDESGETPLHIACGKGCFDLVKQLLATNQCNADARDETGRSPFHLACKMGHTDIVKLLLTRSDINFNARDAHGWFPLELACNNGHLKIVQLLYTADTVDTEQPIEETGGTLLHMACSRGYRDLVEYILAKNPAWANSRNIWGRTPLYLACCYDQAHIVELLLGQSDIDVNAEDDKCNSPLSTARIYGGSDLVDLLLKNERVDAASKIQHYFLKEYSAPLFSYFEED